MKKIWGETGKPISGGGHDPNLSGLRVAPRVKTGVHTPPFMPNYDLRSSKEVQKCDLGGDTRALQEN